MCATEAQEPGCSGFVLWNSVCGAMSNLRYLPVLHATYFSVGLIPPPQMTPDILQRAKAFMSKDVYYTKSVLCSGIPEESRVYRVRFLPTVFPSFLDLEHKIHKMQSNCFILFPSSQNHNPLDCYSFLLFIVCLREFSFQPRHWFSCKIAKNDL